MATVHKWIGCLLVMGLCACQGDDPPARDSARNNGGPENNGTPENNGAPANNGAPVPELLPFEPAQPVFQRLTAHQYRSALKDVFGEPLPQVTLEPDTNPYLYLTIGAASTTVSEHGVELYADAAFAISDAVFSDRARREALVGCSVVAADDACAEAFLRRISTRLYRRPLTTEELGRWLEVARMAGADDAFAGLSLAVAGLLQSPHFPYRVEVGEPDPADPSRRRYTSYEMASRLSFLLWNTAPDQDLLDAAASGQLQDDASLFAHADRLASDPRGRRAVQDFFAQYLDLGRLQNVDRDPELYPGYTPSLPAAMETELRLLVDDLVFRRDGDIRELFWVQRGFVNSELAAIYELEVPGATPVAFVPVEFPQESPRAGILTLAAFLTMNAHPSETSPTLRGKYVRERILCQEVPAPPDDVDLNLDSDPGQPRTLRERLEQHREDPACIGCHVFLDPPGFLFENYDSVGRYRTHESGYEVDATGELDGIALNDAKELAAALRDDPRVAQCLVRQLYRHANGRLETDNEEITLAQISENFAAGGYRFRELLIALVLSDGFRTAAPETNQ